MWHVAILAKDLGSQMDYQTRATLCDAARFSRKDIDIHDARLLLYVVARCCPSVCKPVARILQEPQRANGPETCHD